MTRPTLFTPSRRSQRLSIGRSVGVSLGLTAALLAGSAHADTRPADYDDYASKEETIGFFSGAVLGGLAGGPAGAVIGAAIGAFTGDGQQARKQIGEVQSELLTAQIETERLRKEARQLEQQYQVAMAELDKLRSAPRTLPAFLPGPDTGACCDNTALTVHFRTGSSAIEAQYQGQLEGIARLAANNPNTAIEITGYADRNGDERKNLELSRERSNTVKAFFSERGIDNASITTVAYGENKPLHSAQSLETDFFDRRVIVRLHDTRESLLTQSPDGE